MTTLFEGQWVRLAALDPAADAAAFARWSHDSEYSRLLDGDPALPRSARAVQADLEKEAARDDAFSFGIYTLEQGRHIGFIGMRVMHWAHRDAWMGVGIGDRSCRGQGLGTDAVRVLLRFAFQEISLERVTLGVFSHNRRAIRAYEKAGFVLEGCTRQDVLRDGRRRDSLWMGILRQDWKRATNATAQP